jgi:glucose/arabinose dehydrogenase
MGQPRYYWDPVIAPSRLAFYTGNLFPQWKGNVLVGALRGQMLDRPATRSLRKNRCGGGALAHRGRTHRA